MSIEAVIQEIISEAEEEAKKIIENAKKEAERIRQEYEEKAEKIRQEMEKETEEIIRKIEVKEIANAKLECKRKVAEAKNKVVVSVFNNIEEILAEITGKEREALLKKLIDSCKKEMKDVKTLLCCEKDMDVVKKEFPKAKIEKTDCKGGFIAVSSDESEIYDARFENLTSIYKNEIIKRIFEWLGGKQ